MAIIRMLRIIGILLMLGGVAFWRNFHGLAAVLGFKAGDPAMQAIGGGLFLMGLLDFFVVPHLLRKRMR